MNPSNAAELIVKLWSDDTSLVTGKATNFHLVANLTGFTEAVTTDSLQVTFLCHDTPKLTLSSAQVVVTAGNSASFLLTLRHSDRVQCYGTISMTVDSETGSLPALVVDVNPSVPNATSQSISLASSTSTQVSAGI